MYKIPQTPFQEMRDEHDKLLKIVELVAVGTSWDDFKSLYEDYKSGNELSVWEERAEEVYALGFERGVVAGKNSVLDRDSKNVCPTCLK